jgi:ABC-type transport system involved in multi-copper enzyme maturation permease subunit
MVATFAIFLDAYRELCAKRLFWFVLVLTALVVGAFALVDINEEGLRIIVWDFPAPFFNTTTFSREAFFKFLFINLGVKFWLTWAATILALISTASIIPDFLAGGAVELTLSKPISRVRLFLTKYAAGLLFVALQVLVFSLGAFLIIGFKAGAWEFGLFMAVPIVLVFFSYLYCVCAWLGLRTRSTIASLLLTLLCWFMFSMLGVAENLIAGVSLAADKQVQATQGELDAREKRIATIRDGQQADGALNAVLSNMSLPEQERRLEEARSRLEEQKQSALTWSRWNSGLYIARTILPKTAETIDLLNRSLMTPDEMTKLINSAQDRAEERDNRRGRRTPPADDPDAAPRFSFESPEVQQEIAESARTRPVWWVLGSSLAFEAVILGLACFTFSRKDY